MKNYKVLFLSLFFILFTIMIASILWVNAKIEHSKLSEVSDNVLTLFRHEMQIQKSNALFLSVSLSGDKALKDALLDENEDLGYEILLHKLNHLKQYTFIKDVRAQLLTKDLSIFARSWDNNFAGMPLEGLRKDLQLLQKIRKPKVSIDPGRLLSIKATTPIKDDGQLLGYVEAVKTFDEITNILRKRSIELTVLMFDNCLIVATLMRENPSFGHFIVSNKNYNSIVLSDLKKIPNKAMERENFIVTEKFLHILDVMRDSSGKQIGYNVLSVARHNIDKYEKMKDNISFFLNLSKTDLYNIENNKEKKREKYKNKNRALQERKRENLRGYDKESLINIILEKEHKMKIEGKIR